MTAEKYMQFLQAAMAEFRTTAVELEEENRPLEEWNDEFMLELYECTGDRSRA